MFFWQTTSSKGIFLRAIAVLRKQNLFYEFEEIARNILILAVSPYQSPNSLAERARHNLTLHIRGHTDALSVIDNIPSISIEDESNEDLFNDIDTAETNIHHWVDAMYNDCVSQTNEVEESYDINGFYCIEFAKAFKSLLKYFPLFSETIRTIFGYGSINATSAAVESEFNDLKNRTLKDVSLPMRADKFISKHISSLSGKIKLAISGKLDESVDTNNNKKRTSEE